MATELAQLYRGGTATAGVTATFTRAGTAYSPADGDVGANVPRYDAFKTLVTPHAAPVERVANGDNYTPGFGSTIDSGGENVHLHVVRNVGGTNDFIHFSHGHPNGDPNAAAPAVADGRRYLRNVSSTTNALDPFRGVASGDTMGISCGAMFEDAVLVAGQVNSGTDRGSFIAVGNYTAADGLSGSGGSGERMDLVFTDIDSNFGTASRSVDRTAVWSVSSFVLRNRNEVFFTFVDYMLRSPVANRGGIMVVVRATRSAPGSPWTFNRPVVVCQHDATSAFDHTQGAWLALTTADSPEGAGVLSASTGFGDGAGKNGVWHRSIANPDLMERYHFDYTYNGNAMELAMAGTPLGQWSSLTGWAESGDSVASAWSAERMVAGRRITDGATSDWGCDQFVGSASGTTKNTCVLTGDVTYGSGLYLYDADSWDFDTGYPQFAPVDTFTPLSHFGYVDTESSNNGFFSLTIYTDNQWEPTYWGLEGSYANIGVTANKRGFVALGKADDGDIVFGVVARENGVRSVHPYLRDGKVHLNLGFGGGSPTLQGAHTLTFDAEPAVIVGRSLGAGHDNYKMLHNHTEAGAGTNQANSAALFDFETNTSNVPAAIDTAFCTDAEITALENAIGMPGNGAVLRCSKADGQATGGRGSLLFIHPNRFISELIGQTKFGAHSALLNFSNGIGEVLFWIAHDPLGVARHRQSRWSVRLGNRVDNQFLGAADDTPLNNFYMGSTPRWVPFRMIVRDAATLDALSLYIEQRNNDASSGGADEQYETYLLYGGVTAYAGSEASSFYPIGYCGPSNVDDFGWPAQTNPGDGDYLPDEVQTVALPEGSEGTVTYRCVAHPEGVDYEYYQLHEDNTITADHAIFSLVEDATNYIEVGWRNGRTLYVKSRSGGSETTTLGDNTAYLNRKDQMIVAVRYGGGDTTVDIFHSGEQTTIVAVNNPSMTNPEARCGSHDLGRTLPIVADAIGHFDTSLSDETLLSSVSGGDAFAIQTRKGAGPAVIYQWAAMNRRRRMREQR